MEERISHVAGRFKNRFGLGSPSGAPQFPSPPSPSHHGRSSSQGGSNSGHGPPPPIPPRPGGSNDFDDIGHPSPPSVSRSVRLDAGAIYAPGAFPTPELPGYPLQRYQSAQILRESAIADMFVLIDIAFWSPHPRMNIRRRPSRWLLTSSVLQLRYTYLRERRGGSIRPLLCTNIKRSRPSVIPHRMMIWRS